ncbi:MAG: 1-acylglycerol-3-phosphate O-acyltransferase [Acidimicrobiia bacterium]|nr:1-acylglycerol-3-phosphate O-acyltransferase [Acidimicrobiia bacterium]
MTMGSRARLVDIPRTVVTVVVGVVATIIAAVSVIVISRFSPTNPLVDKVARWWGQSWLTASRTTVATTGLENIDVNRSYMVVANHQSNMDVFATFVAMPIPIRFLAKAELFKIPLLAPAMRAIGIVEVDRNARRAIHEFVNTGTQQLIAAGRSVIIFPEGTRSPDGSLLPFKKGAFTMAVAAGLPILPVTISGSGEAWPAGSRIIRGGHIDIRVDPALETADMRLGDSGILLSQVRELMLDNRNQLGEPHGA